MFFNNFHIVLPDSSVGQESTCKSRRRWFYSLVGKIRWRRDRLATPIFLGFPCVLACKGSACNVRDLGLIPGLGRSPGERNSYPLQYSGLEKSMDCIVHGITELDTTEQLSLTYTVLHSGCTNLHSSPYSLFYIPSVAFTVCRLFNDSHFDWCEVIDTSL